MAFALLSLTNCAKLSIRAIERSALHPATSLGLAGVFASPATAAAAAPKVQPIRLTNSAATHHLAGLTISDYLREVRQYSNKSAGVKQGYESASDSDSDAENPGKGRERGDSEFWRRKMRTLHGLLDINKDGVISYEDFMLLAEKFGELGHLKPESLVEFREVMKTTWEEQWGEITPYNLVTVEQYLADMHHVLNDKKLKSKVHRFLPYLFKAVDKDHSGFISLKEFKLFFVCLGLTEEDAAVSFAIIDKNGDGKLSIKEFVKLGRDFFLTENDRKISKMFWGPLVEH